MLEALETIEIAVLAGAATEVQCLRFELGRRDLAVGDNSESRQGRSEVSVARCRGVEYIRTSLPAG